MLARSTGEVQAWLTLISITTVVQVCFPDELRRHAGGDTKFGGRGPVVGIKPSAFMQRACAPTGELPGRLGLLSIFKALLNYLLIKKAKHSVAIYKPSVCAK